MPERASADVIGLTTTVPVEIIFAAGGRPCDLNNVFITSGRAGELVAQAERAGFPESTCAWTKGIYAVAHDMGLRRLVGVTEGDCANTHALMEMLEYEGVAIIPFGFPFRRDAAMLRTRLQTFARALDVSLSEAEAWKQRLDEVRALAHRLDELAWGEGKVSGAENHHWLIACSDFFGDPDTYRQQAAAFLAEALARPPRPPRLRLALVGIPPICEGLHDVMAEFGADTVFDEIPRQFAMPCPTGSLLDQYRAYTYPYDIFIRLADIRSEIKRRAVHGVIHYVQSFCFRRVQDVHLRRELDVPVLTLECDRPGMLDARARTRLEAFLEMLEARAH